MPHITITLDEGQAQQLATLANQRGVAVEEVARQLVVESVRKERFQEILAYELEKNAELYRRLAQGPRD